jgi:hypothetical protein
MRPTLFMATLPWQYHCIFFSFLFNAFPNLVVDCYEGLFDYFYCLLISRLFGMQVILTRELKRCPSFSNLKTLSLGEWSMNPGFDALVFLMQHSPNLERLFLELKLV